MHTHAPPPPHTHTHFLWLNGNSNKISTKITQQKNLNFKNPTGNATLLKIFHRESSGIEISKRNSNWKLIILYNLPKLSAGIFLSNVTGSNWNHTWYQNLPQCSAGTCIKLTNISWLDLTFNPAGIGIPVSFFHRGGVDFKWNSPFCNKMHKSESNAGKKHTSGPRYWDVPVLVNTGTFLVYQHCLKMW